MTIKELFVRLGLKFDEKGFDKADKAVRGVESAANTLVQVFATGAIAMGLKAIVTGAVDAASNVENLSSRLGISAQKLQELSYAADMADIGQEQLGVAMQFLARNAADAATKGGEAGKVFTKLGVNLRGADGEIRPVDQLLADVSDGMKGMTSDSERLRYAVQLFGREGARMVNMLGNGSGELDLMAEAARATGGVMDSEFLATAEKTEQAIKRFNWTMTGLRNTIAARLLPIATRLANAMQVLVRGFVAVAGRSKVVEIGLTVLGVAAAALAFALTMKLLVAIASMNLGLVALAGKFLLAGDSALLMQMKSMLIGAALLTLAALIVLVADEIWTFFSGGKTIMGEYATKIGELYDWFMKLGEDSPIERFLLAPLKAVLWTAKKTVEALFAVGMAATGDFSGVKMLAAEFKETMIDVPGAYLDKGMAQLPGVGLANRLLGSDTATASPASAAASAGATNVVAPTMSANVTVNAAPGQSEEKVGNAAAVAIDQHFANWVEQSAQGLLPLSPLAATGGGG